MWFRLSQHILWDVFGFLVQAKYYLKMNLIEIGKVHAPSYAWSSLMAARHIMEKGLIWKIRNGRKVKV